MAYSGFDSFVEPARARAEVWRTALGLAVALAIYAVGAMAVIVAGGFAFRGIVAPEEIADGSTPPALLILLFHFVAMVFAAWVVVRLIHKRSFASLFGPLARVRADFLKMAGIALSVALVFSLVALVFEDLTPNTPPGTWLLFLPLALPLILLQTGAEEIVFRGYLLQQLGARFGVAARAAWMLLPALIFASLHVDAGSQGSNVWAVLAVITLFAVITADLTARTGSLGAAWGLHFVNNCQAMLIFSLAGPLDGMSLARVSLAASSPEALPLFALDAAGLLIIYAIWRSRNG